MGLPLVSNRPKGGHRRRPHNLQPPRLHRRKRNLKQPPRRRAPPPSATIRQVSTRRIFPPHRRPWDFLNNEQHSRKRLEHSFRPQRSTMKKANHRNGRASPQRCRKRRLRREEFPLGSRRSGRRPSLALLFQRLLCHKAYRRQRAFPLLEDLLVV